MKTETSEELDLNTYWEKALSYADYRETLKTQAENGQTSGPNQSESLIEYTRLNDRRSKRWEKKFQLETSERDRLQTIQSPQRWLVLNESWCGDAAHTLPVMEKIAEATDKLELKVLWRDENLELMDRYLSHGTRGIPKLLILDEQGELLGEWGSRPAPLHQFVQESRDKEGNIPAGVKEDIQQWYNADKGRTTAQELSELLSTFLEKDK
jgi:hypothetical protein